MFKFDLVGSLDGKQYINVFVPDHGFLTADSDHPSFGMIVRALTADEQISDEQMVALFNVAEGVSVAVAQNAALSSRVSITDGQIVLDGNVLSEALTDHILKLASEQSGDLTGWVRFLERIDANPNEHSRKALFSWLDSLGRNDDGITIDAKTGFLVGYKGVAKLEDDSLVSVHSGPAIVDGVEHKSGQVPNAVGSVIEMRRDDVQHDPSIGCSRGLHVGTWAYASGWAQGAVLEVHVDPADVVSVPTDCDAQKMRCSKYEVVNVLDVPYSSATLDPETDDSEFWYDEDDDESDASDLPEGYEDYDNNPGQYADDSADWCGLCYDGDDVKQTDNGHSVCTFCQRVVAEA